MDYFSLLLDNLSRPARPELLAELLAEADTETFADFDAEDFSDLSEEIEAA